MVKSWKPKKGYVSAHKQCYETHPPLKFGKAVVFGGSCLNPVVDDAYTYVGLDRGMCLTGKSLPWHDGEEFLFAITDHSVPKSAPEFKKLIAHLSKRISEGRRIHIGCIGGHGRTGMVLSALVREVKGEADAITWVRKHYCKKSVETTTQVEFLVKHFGVKKVGVSTPAYVGGTSAFTGKSYNGYGDGEWWSREHGFYTGIGVVAGDTVPPKTEASRQFELPAIPSERSIWGK